MLNDVTIKLDGPGRGHLWLNGEPLRGVRGFSLRGEVGEVNELTVKLLCNRAEFEGECDVTAMDDETMVFSVRDGRNPAFSEFGPIAS